MACVGFFAAGSPPGITPQMRRNPQGAKACFQAPKGMKKCDTPYGVCRVFCCRSPPGITPRMRRNPQGAKACFQAPEGMKKTTRQEGVSGVLLLQVPHPGSRRVCGVIPEALKLAFKRRKE